MASDASAPDHVGHIEQAESLIDKADDMALGSAADVIALANAHAFLGVAKILSNFWDEEFGDE